VEEVVRIAGLDRVPRRHSSATMNARKPVLTTLQKRTRQRQARTRCARLP
jgi:phenylalanyl-tRNA synthetase beta subunit